MNCLWCCNTQYNANKVKTKYPRNSMANRVFNLPRVLVDPESPS